MTTIATSSPSATPTTGTRSPNAPVAVIGATGKTGRRVVAGLTALDIPVRPLHRASNPPFVWHDLATWDAALAGARAVYITYPPDLSVPGAADKISALATLAAAAGVERLVLLSGRGEPAAQAAEQRLATTGLPWTVVRAAWFSQNFSENYLLDAIQSDTVALPVGDVREPFIDADDIAAVAVAALTEDGHAGQVYEVTGPRLLTFAEAVAEIAAAAGREIAFVPVTIDAYCAELDDAGLPASVIELLRYLFVEVLDGRGESLTDGVQRAIGRPPRDFRDYAARAAATGVWSSPEVASSPRGSASLPA